MSSNKCSPFTVLLIVLVPHTYTLCGCNTLSLNVMSLWIERPVFQRTQKAKPSHSPLYRPGKNRSHYSSARQNKCHIIIPLLPLSGRCGLSIAFETVSQSGSQIAALINERPIYKVSSTLTNLRLERAVRAGEMKMRIDRKERDKLL